MKLAFTIKVLEGDSVRVMAKLQEHREDGLVGKCCVGSQVLSATVSSMIQWEIILTRQETNNTTHILTRYTHDIEDYVT